MSNFAVESRRAPLAGMAPSLADGGAAHLSRANNPLQIDEALAVLDFRVTRTDSVIGIAASSGVAVNARATIGPDASALIQTGLSADC